MVRFRVWNTHESGRYTNLQKLLNHRCLLRSPAVSISADGAKSLAGRKTPSRLTSRGHDPVTCAPRSLRLAQDPEFPWFIIGLLTMNVATQLQAVVVSWQVYALTRDPLSRGLIGLAEALPFIGFSLPAGHLSRSFGLSLRALVVSGMVDTVSVVVRSTLLEVLTPEPLLGRVSSVNAIFIGSSNEIGAFESGGDGEAAGDGAVGGGRWVGDAAGRDGHRVPSARASAAQGNRVDAKRGATRRQRPALLNAGSG
jgi:hypothetical protein